MITPETLMASYEEARKIEDNEHFKHLEETTQVVVPKKGRSEVCRTRFSHSYEVATSAMTMLVSIAIKLGVHPDTLDRYKSLENVCKIHDLGHPAFGHDGATYLDKKFKSLGLEEGFSDNNNTLQVIQKNRMPLRSYTVASAIKYPDKLYDSQKAVFLPLLDQAVEEDKKHLKSHSMSNTWLKRTIACEIMDEADRNSYTFSDMCDHLLNDGKLDRDIVLSRALDKQVSPRTMQKLEELVNLAESRDKSSISLFLSQAKGECNKAYEVTEYGLEMTDRQQFEFREFVNKLTKEFFIRPIRKMPVHASNMQKLEHVTNAVISGEFRPSRTYASAIENATDRSEQLRAMRDMVAEFSDWYVIRTHEKLLRNELLHSI